MADRVISKCFLLLLLVTFCSAQGASNIESIQVEPAAAVVAPPAVVEQAAAVPPPPAVVTPAAAVSTPVAAATPAIAPVVPPPAAAIPPGNGISGTTTEHKTPDGSIITVTKFNGQLPANTFHQHFPQMFGSISPFGNPFYGIGAPLYPAYGRSIRSADGHVHDAEGREAETTKTEVSKDDDHDGNPNGKRMKRSQLKKRERVSDKFHYPSPAPDYFSMYKKPFVPVIDNEFSDLI